MRKMFMISALFFVGSLCAAMIGPVEYQLPDVVKTWEALELADGDEQINGQMVGWKAPESEEVFTAMFASEEGVEEALDQTEAAFQKALEGMGMNMHVATLEKDENSLFCKYSVVFDGESAFVVMRMFALPEGIVTLMHATNVSENLEDDLWAQVLQNAKVVHP